MIVDYPPVFRVRVWLNQHNLEQEPLVLFNVYLRVGICPQTLAHCRTPATAIATTTFNMFTILLEKYASTGLVTLQLTEGEERNY